MNSGDKDMRKTKIICTLGPSTDDEQVLRELMLSGMDVARFNFSHGDHASHKETFEKVIKLRQELNKPIATLLDTKGPEIRIQKFENGRVTLNKEDQFILTTREVQGNEKIVGVNYKDLPKDVSEGSVILLDDGLIELSVLKVDGTDIICKVMNSGSISNNKGVNLPGTRLSMPYLSPKDREDIIFGIKMGFNFIAASFARSAEDILAIRKILDEHDCHTINVIAKIENREGVDNIDEIIRVTDGIMVARGDMGVEIPAEEVPALQKMIIKKVYNSGKQVITATQMLDSMMKNPRPTRAETNDVANAIYDGTSAIMLSGETAAGLYPVEAVKTMVRIAIRTENDIDYIKRFQNDASHKSPNVTSAISHATCTTAHDLGAAAIITVTKSGRTARMISKYRPVPPILGCTSSPHVYHQLNLSWGVTPLLITEEENADSLFEQAIEAAEKTGIVENGELVVITSGIPLGISGTTNMIKVDVVGHILVSGTGITTKTACANVCVCKNTEDAIKNFNEGDILVISQTTNELLPLLKKASGIITEQDGLNSHAAIVGLAIDIPVIIGAPQATEILKSGSVVIIDASRGIVSNK
ncbi:MAG: pyruvate kinase [Clostridia bacterium]|jgi:pyruvate kinase|nr:pyruvate kinase [Clostridia bacterium]